MSIKERDVMTAPKTLKQTMTLIGLLLLLFFFHRIMIREYIGLDLITGVSAVAKVYFIGLLSDFWIASIFTLPFLIKPNRIYLLVLFPSLAFGLATQVPYVEFFQTSLRWVHLPYLVDTEFIRSSGTFFERPRVWLSLIWGGTLSYYLICRFRLLNQENFASEISGPLSTRVKIFFGLLLCAVSANALSHRWSRDLNFSGKLTQNPFVQLVLDGVEQNKIQSESKPREHDLAVLKEANRLLGTKSFAVLNENSARLLANGFVEGSSADLAFISEGLKASFSEETLKKENRYFIVVIAESLRAAESHLLTPQTKGFTPALDLMSEKGVAFSKGYSSSVVSRSGAESTVCNFISTISLNTMRDNPVERSMCAREIFQKRLSAKGIDSSFSWLHGGYHGFDNQGQFYRTAGFDIPFDILKLPADLPRTHWGLSDKTLMALSSEWFSEREKRFQSGLHFVALVTVSNHTAWDLPSDADPSLFELQKKDSSPHFATVRYADGALGSLIENLKKKGIWQKVMMVVVGDHGTQVAAYDKGAVDIPGFGLSAEGDLKTAEHLSRVYFSLGGGLVEQGVVTCKKHGLCKSGLVQTHPVSQIDILPTLADVLPLDDHFPWFGVSLFKQNRLWPVFSDLGDYFYIPQSPEALRVKKDVYISEDPVPQRIEWKNFSAFMRLYASLVRQGRLRKSLYGEVSD